MSITSCHCSGFMRIISVSRVMPGKSDERGKL
jgi:hypothetical protein